MDKFLGLPIVRKPLTDAKLVERARKDGRRWQRYGKWLVLFQAALLVASGVAISTVASIVIKLGGNQGLGEFILGVVIGMAFGIPALHIMYELVSSLGKLQGDRSLQLLVRYHDMLAELARMEEPSTPPEQAGLGRAGDKEG